MPAHGTNNDERGDIVLKFKIQMPRYLPETSKELCETMSKTDV